jgi:hypothetical protein
MTHSASREHIAAVRETVAAVKRDLAALNAEFQETRRDAADAGAFERATASRLSGFNPRSAQDRIQLGQDEAGKLLWTLYLRARPRRREHIQAQLERDLRLLVQRLWQIVDYFESPFCSPDALLPMLTTASAESLAGNVLATAENVLRLRLPAHEPITETAAPVDQGWRERTYAMLLQNAKREPVE